jgi:putative NIF3 family GTP cyclohydrolase 1 type 2
MRDPGSGFRVPGSGIRIPRTGSRATLPGIMDISRRSFLVAGTCAAATGVPVLLRAEQGGQGSLTAADIIQRIKDHVGVPWREQTVDTFIAGAAQTKVKGIATTMMSTLDVVQRASAAGKNLVITHEPTFYSHQDTTDALKQDPAYLFKDQFLRAHGMVIFRFHDHWHARRPDGIATGMTKELGWEKNADSDNPRQFVFSGTTLGDLARDLETKLKIRTMRVVGDPKLAVTRVATSWGYYTFNPANLVLAKPDVDVLVVGEAREWELVEYTQDLIASGKKKGLIVLGHVVSEQAGMKYCADWLKGFISEVPIDFIPAAEPFWRPGQTG